MAGSLVVLDLRTNRLFKREIWIKVYASSNQNKRSNDLCCHCYVSFCWTWWAWIEVLKVSVRPRYMPRTVWYLRLLMACGGVGEENLFFVGRVLLSVRPLLHKRNSLLEVFECRFKSTHAGAAVGCDWFNTDRIWSKLAFRCLKTI